MNRRREWRDPVHARLWIVWLRPDGRTPSWKCKSFDVSPNGLNIEIPALLPPGAKVLVECPGLAGSVEGTVQNSREYGYWFRIGLALDESPDFEAIRAALVNIEKRENAR